MKYFGILLVLVTLIGTGTTNAQSRSIVNGNTYIYIMKDAVLGGEEEIVDKITFNNNRVTSENYSGTRGGSGNPCTEIITGETAQIEFTFKNSKYGTMKFNGTAVETAIYGTIVITDANGNNQDMLFRGLTIQEYDRIQKMKSDYNNQQ